MQVPHSLFQSRIFPYSLWGNKCSSTSRCNAGFHLNHQFWFSLTESILHCIKSKPELWNESILIWIQSRIIIDLVLQSVNARFPPQRRDPRQSAPKTRSPTVERSKSKNCIIRKGKCISPKTWPTAKKETETRETGLSTEDIKDSKQFMEGISLIKVTHGLLLLFPRSRSSSWLRLLRKSPKVSESTFFDICLSRNQSSYWINTFSCIVKRSSHDSMQANVCDPSHCNMMYHRQCIVQKKRVKVEIKFSAMSS